MITNVGQGRRYRAKKKTRMLMQPRAIASRIDPHVRAERARAMSITRVYRKRVTKGLKLHTLPGPIYYAVLCRIPLQLIVPFLAQR